MPNLNYPTFIDFFQNLFIGISDQIKNLLFYHNSTFINTSEYVKYLRQRKPLETSCYLQFKVLSYQPEYPHSQPF